MDTKGKIIAIRGVVIDMVFDSNPPKIYDAVEIVQKNSEGNTVVVEVLQQLEDGVVRGIAMDSTDGLTRGSEAINTGAPISVPVGQGVLGHIFDVLGRPIDGSTDIQASDKWPIHRAAPAFTELTNKAEIYETGIKVIDLIAPMLKGGKVGLFGGA